MEQTDKSKIAASDINYYIQARLGTLSDLSHSADVLLLPTDFLDGEDTINPYAMPLSDALITEGYKALMAIGPNVKEGKQQGAVAVLPQVLIMNTYKKKDILGVIAEWLESGSILNEIVSVTIMVHDASLISYPVTTYSGSVKEVSDQLKK